STGSAWVNFNIRFYLVALIFIIFEVEIAFIFPVAAVFRNLVESGEGVLAFVKILLFIGILFLGLIYSWAKGDLEWVKKVKA
ncbi:MAG: NADH-quinone oxidoreductase subunit A, partial [Candidatus Binatia bacterium]